MLFKNEIKYIKGLSERTARTDYGRFVVEGDKMVGELLDAGLKVENIYLTERSRLFGMEGAVTVTEKEMERISGLRTPSSALAVVHIPKREFVPQCAKGELVLALDDLQDPGNLGTIIRIADWYGIRHIFCSAHTVDCYNPKCVQATMGALFRVEVHYGDLPSMLREAKEEGVAIYGTLLDGENIYEKKITESGIIIIGNEGKGISAEVERLVDTRLFLPSWPTDCRSSESLNAAVATAVVCAEFRRRQIMR